MTSPREERAIADQIAAQSAYEHATLARPGLITTGHSNVSVGSCARPMFNPRRRMTDLEVDTFNAAGLLRRS